MSEDRPKSAKGLKPKILNADPPGEEQQDEATKKHNREMENRAEKPTEQIESDDSADKKGGTMKDFKKGDL
ncbi:hypothetical protein BT63DRAFT_68261 [Microthyrium microscopicum]|uniref:Uncharacterized protein n=1 Tax=Microthyrium microscopicum TaxID=703497 RepID=A0A6A6TZN9_9PEZI|nr:hypothetical protein BT63DRAFT_68261 [Microthyrium microscopicum]